MTQDHGVGHPLGVGHPVRDSRASRASRDPPRRKTPACPVARPPRPARGTAGRSGSGPSQAIRGRRRSRAASNAAAPTRTPPDRRPARFEQSGHRGASAGAAAVVRPAAAPSRNSSSRPSVSSTTSRHAGHRHRADCPALTCSRAFNGTIARGLVRYQNAAPPAGRPRTSGSQRVWRRPSCSEPVRGSRRRVMKPCARSATGSAYPSDANDLIGAIDAARPVACRSARARRSSVRGRQIRRTAARPTSSGRQRRHRRTRTASASRLAAAAASISGRRRFTGRERRRQRIAARQRGRHRQRRCRPPLRIPLEAAQDDALDRRIEVAHDRRRRRDRPGVVQLLQIAERLRVVGAAAGEDLEQDQARARRCRS